MYLMVTGWNACSLSLSDISLSFTHHEPITIIKLCNTVPADGKLVWYFPTRLCMQCTHWHVYGVHWHVYVVYTLTCVMYTVYTLDVLLYNTENVKKDKLYYIPHNITLCTFSSVSSTLTQCTGGGYLQLYPVVCTVVPYCSDVYALYYVVNMQPLSSCCTLGTDTNVVPVVSHCT